jgi:hypothetical protein
MTDSFTEKALVEQGPLLFRHALWRCRDGAL